MKKLSSLYVLVMVLLIVVMPMVIVKSFSSDYQIRDISNEHGKVPKDSTLDKNKLYINVYMDSDKKYQKMLLEEYVKGVVAAEMPSSFNIEALKAQAVAARTYSFVRMDKNYKPRDGAHLEAPICTNPAHCQAYVSKETVIKRSGMVAGLQKWRKIENAVNSTMGMVIYYNGNPANPLFHSSSGGMTEDAALVWGGKSVPYLMPVKSPGEEGVPGFQTIIELSKEQFVEKLMASATQNATVAAWKTFSLANSFSVEKVISIEKRSSSNRVLNIKIGNSEFTGAQIRAALGLRSTNFNFTEDAGKVKITTIGFGHGVGMSQYGADAMAKSGAGYLEILEHYYTGVNIKKAY